MEMQKPIDEVKTKKKNQHFVPRFYLRNFSIGGDGRQIVVCNLEKRIFIKAASLADQAAKKYYYGMDGMLEDSLSKLEGEMAKTISKIKKTACLPAHSSRDHRMLLYFAVTTEIRNPVFAQRLQEMTESMGEMIKLHVDFPEKYRTPEYRFGLKDPVLSSFLNYRKHVIILSDLHCKLLRNQTELPFITSDNPVIQYNQFLEQKTEEKSITGFATKGLQVFVPISSQLMLMLYDSQVYYVGSRKRKIVDITEPKEISQLNVLQFMNCCSNVYGNEYLSETYVQKLKLDAQQFDKPGKEFVEILPGDQENSFWRKSGTTSPRTKLRLSFVAFSTHAERYDISSKAIHGRPFAEDAIDAFQNDPRFEGLNDW